MYKSTSAQMKLHFRILTIASALLFSTVAMQAARPKGKTSKPTVSAEAIMSQAVKAFEEYRFDDAEQLLEDYDTQCRKSKKTPDSEAVESLTARINLGRSMLDRVEKIAVIDSITVDADQFFKAYRLSAPTGSFTGTYALPDRFVNGDETSVFLTENGETMIWGAKADDGKYRLMESTHLADGSWETPHSLGDALGLGANANYPFLLSDGVTLYYASDGEGSIGGYDIFISRNNGEEFLQPQNMGMPYNSIHNDYLLAIDEITGAGWWATDRNQIPGKITIYVFVPQELRINYPVDTPDLADRAKLTSIAATQNEDADYTTILDKISEPLSTDSTDNNRQSFRFAMPGGKTYTSMSDFRTPAGAAAMQEYLNASKRLHLMERKVAGLRAVYARGDKRVSEEILRSEQQLENDRKSLQRIANSVVKAETGR